MNKKLLVGGVLAVAGLALFVTPKAEAGVNVAIGFGIPVPVVAAPVYVVPAYYAPAPRVYAPVVVVNRPYYYARPYCYGYGRGYGYYRR